MRLLSQRTSLRVEVVATLGQEVQEEENQVSQETDEALMTNLETVFLNRVEVAQDQAAELEDLSEADLEDQILAELEGQVTAANQIPAELEDLSEADLEDQILAELEGQVTAANQIPAELEDLSEADLEDQILAELGFHSHKDFIKYSIVGFSGVIINLGTYIFLTRYIGIAPEIAPILSIEFSLISNFLFNNFWTFKTRLVESRLLSRLFQFHLVAGFSGIFNYVMFFLCYKYLMMNDIVSNLLGICAAAILNYLINSNWTWKGRS